MTFEDFLIRECGYLHVRRLPDGKRFAAIMPLMFTYAIVTVRDGDFNSTADRWCYHNLHDACTALDAWDGTGEPTGWHRHPATGRRRPNGDATQEYIAP